MFGILTLYFVVNYLNHFHQPESEEPFYKSTAFNEGEDFINRGGKLLCFIGQWGSGKTSTAKQVYMSITKQPPKVIQNPLTFNVGDQPIIFDEAFSKEITEIEQNQLRDKIKKLYENMSRSGIKPFIIITLDEDMEDCYGFVESLCKEEIKYIKLSENLTKVDRTQILHSHFETFSQIKNISKVEQLALTGQDHSLGYPEICALISKCRTFQKAGPVVFCNRPLAHLKMYLEKMHKSKDNETFLMLVYMSLNQMEIDVNISNDMLFEILRSCGCVTTKNDSDSKTMKMKSTKTTKRKENDAYMELNSMTKDKKNDKNKEYLKTLLSKEFVVRKADTSRYRLQHDVIKRMTLIVFGTFHFDKLLAFSKPEELKGWIKKKNTIRNIFKQGEINPVLEITKEHWRQYQAKMSIT